MMPHRNVRYRLREEYPLSLMKYKCLDALLSFLCMISSPLNLLPLSLFTRRSNLIGFWQFRKPCRNVCHLHPVGRKHRSQLQRVRLMVWCMPVLFCLYVTAQKPNHSPGEWDCSTHPQGLSSEYKRRIYPWIILVKALPQCVLYEV